MKNLILLLLILMACSAFGQKKKDKDLQAQIDTLTKANQSLTTGNKVLTAKSDSLAKELEKYFGMYTIIRDKVVKKEFDPANMSQIIDSLRSGRDSVNLPVVPLAVPQSPDSIRILKHAIDSLTKETTGLLYAVNLLRGTSGTNPTELKDFTGTWNLTVRKMKVVGQAPRMGIIDISAEPVSKTATFLEKTLVTSITFLDKEFAEFTFSNGEKGKCYYVITDFSKTKPYYIDFKGIKADIRIHFMNTVSGPRISYQIPEVEGVFYFGQITK